MRSYQAKYRKDLAALKISAVAFTDKGMQLGKMLQQNSDDVIELSRCGEGELYKWTEEKFSSSEALVFIGAAGIAVRAISSYVRSKSLDPAVIVMDELGKFAIPILSGHIGGANKLASALARLTDGIPVITTATDLENVFSVDVWAKSVGLRIANIEAIKYVSSKLLSGEIVHYDSIFPISGATPKGIELSGPDDASDFSITYLSSVPNKILHLVPPVLTLGIGCKKGKSCESIEEAYTDFLSKCGCHPLAVREVCSIDLKAQEGGLIEFCEKHGLPFRTFTSDELSNVIGKFTPSEFVEQVAGVDNVCERSAVLGSGGNLFVRKMIFDGVTMALAIKEPDISEEE